MKVQIDTIYLIETIYDLAEDSRVFSKQNNRE